MHRALLPLEQWRRIRVFHATLARAALMLSSISVEFSPPAEAPVYARVPGGAQLSAGIRGSFPRARPDPLDVDRDRDATYFRSNSAKLLGTPKALGTGGAFLAKARRPSAKSTLSRRENKLLIENRPFDVAIARDWRTAARLKNFLRARRLRWACRTRHATSPCSQSFRHRT